MTVLVWLEQTECQEIERVGAKAAHLSKLFTTHRVPNGFCITTDAYHRWGKVVLTNSQHLPAEVFAPVRTAYAHLVEKGGGSTLPVAIRSSAVGEDSKEASFAGQYATYLNVWGAEQVIQSIMRCWASANDSRVQTYMHQQTSSVDKPKLAVLVQEMIAADSSLVIFSRNPVSGNENEIVVNATWGLGESLVGGTVTPDNYIIDKVSLSIQHRQVAEKKHMTVLAPNGVRKIAVPRLLRTRSCLTDNQVAMAAHLAIALEQSMGWPVDIECVYHGETLYLLQCRPITTV